MGLFGLALNQVIAYAATVFIEATTAAEGRGTTTPFELFGAPFLPSPQVSLFICWLCDYEANLCLHCLSGLLAMVVWFAYYGRLRLEFCGCAQ